MRTLGLILPILVLSFCHSASVMAKTTEQKSLKKLEVPTVNFLFETYLNSSLHQTSDPEHQMNTDVSLSPSMKLKNGMTLKGSLSGNKDLKGEREWAWNDGSIGLSGNLAKYDKLTVNGSTSATIPLSEESTKYRKLRTAITIGPGFAWKVYQGVNFNLAPSLKYYFYQYETSLDGKSNNQYSARLNTSLGFDLTDSVSLSFGGRYARNYTHEGNTKDSYELSQTLGFQVTEKTGLELGHSTGGSPLSANGKETEIEIFNERESTVWFGLNHTF